jgi:hypothetical protein
MLELRNSKLQLVEIVARDEIQLVDERAQHRHRLLAQLRLAPTHACGQLAEQLFEGLRQPAASSVGHEPLSGSPPAQTDARETRAS